MAQTPDDLMLEILALQEHQNMLSRKALEQFLRAGEGVHHITLAFESGEEPAEHWAKQINDASAKGRAFQKQMLEIECQMVPLIQELAQITDKREYGKYLNRLKVTPREFAKMRRLRDKWEVFEQALTWEADRVERGATYVSDELTRDGALKLVTVFERERDQPLEFEKLNPKGRLKLIAESQLQIAMGNRRIMNDTIEMGNKIAAMRERFPDDWEKGVEKAGYLKRAKLALLLHDNWPEIKAIIERETAQAVVANRIYYYPSVREALRLVGALPPLQILIPQTPSDVAFLEEAEAETGISKEQLLICIAIHEHRQKILEMGKKDKFIDVEECLIELGLLRELG